MDGVKRWADNSYVATAHVAATLALISIFSFGSAYGAVTVSGTQAPGNPVILGDTISYSLTVSAASNQADVFINISIYINGVSANPSFSSKDCSRDGLFYCNQLGGGSSQIYTFLWTTPPTGRHELRFDVNCGNTACEESVLFSSNIVDSYGDIPRLTENETQIAISFDNACSALEDTYEVTGTPGKLLDACRSLDGVDGATILTALQRITPTQAPAQGRSSLNISEKQFGNINSRMSALRSGSVGASVSGLRMRIQDVSLPISVYSEMFENKSNGFSDNQEATALYGRLGVFVNGNISIGDRDATNNEAGFDFSTEGITVGADYRLNKKVVTGVALGYVNHETEYGSARGEMDVRGYSLSFFGSYYRSSKTYWDVIASIGENSFDSQRDIQFGLISEQVTGSTSGLEFSLGLGGGYDYNQGGFTFGSYGRVNLVRADIDSYQENSSSGFELAYGQQSVRSLTTVFGGQVSFAMSTRYGVLSPQLRFEWVHELQDESRYITASFVNDPSSSSFRIRTDAPDKNFWNAGAGISATLSEGRSAFFYIDTIAGKDNITQTTYSAGFRLDY